MYTIKTIWCFIIQSYFNIVVISLQKQSNVNLPQKRKSQFKIRKTDLRLLAKYSISHELCK